MPAFLNGNHQIKVDNFTASKNQYDQLVNYSSSRRRMENRYVAKMKILELEQEYLMTLPTEQTEFHAIEADVKSGISDQADAIELEDLAERMSFEDENDGDYDDYEDNHEIQDYSDESRNEEDNLGKIEHF